jgi:hypothetical protein
MTQRVRSAFPITWVPPWTTGRKYGQQSVGTHSTLTNINSTLYSVPVYVPNQAGVTATVIGIEEVTAAGSALLARLGIYHDNGGRPGDLLLDAGTVALDTASPPVFLNKSISQFLHQGWYWLALQANGGTGTIRAYASGAHFALMSRTDELGTGNNPLGVIASPGATLGPRYVAAGLPGQFPTTGRPSHVTVPWVYLEI